MTLDAATRTRKRAIEAELREIKQFEAEDRAAAPKVIGEPGEATPRRFLTRTQKLTRWITLGKVCQWCGEPCFWEGQLVIWDHRIALELRGSNDIANMDPHHSVECAPAKTREDMRRIAKAKRIAAKHFGPRDPSKHPLKGRPFERRRGAT